MDRIRKILDESSVDEHRIQECIKDADHLLAKGDILAAEREYCNCLKHLLHTDNAFLQFAPLEGLGNVYYRRGQEEMCTERYTQAAGLYNAAMSRLGDNPELKSKVVSKIEETENAFLELISSSLGVELMRKGADSGDYSQYLKNLRQYCMEEIQLLDIDLKSYDVQQKNKPRFEMEETQISRVRDLYADISKVIKKFTGLLVDQCISMLGKPPCEFSLVAFGSLARTEMTPYSDLEFGLLIDPNISDTDGDCRNYFRCLIRYFQLKVIILGETILPSLAIPALNDFYSEDDHSNWFYDAFTKRGFAFDGNMPHACKTPLGRTESVHYKGFELIGTPSSLSEYVINDPTDTDSGKTGHLRMTLLNSDWLYGNREIFNKFSEEIRRKLHNRYESIDGKLAISKDCTRPTLGTSLAKKLLKSDLCKYETDLDKRRLLGKQFMVKSEIYRLPSTVVNGLALFYDVDSGSAWDVVDSLFQHGKLNEESRHNLLLAVTIASELRLRAYLKSGRQREQLTTLPNFNLSDSSIVSDELTRNLIERFYTTIVPFETEVKKLLHNENASCGCIEGNLYDESNTTRGLVCLRLLQLNDAAEYFKKEVEELKLTGASEMKLFEAMRLHGYTFYQMSDYSRGQKLYEECERLTGHIKDEKDRRTAAFVCQNNLGTVHFHKGAYEESKHYFMKSYQMRQALSSFVSKEDVSLAASNLGAVLWETGQYDVAGKLFLQAFEIRKQLHGEMSANPDMIGSYNNLSGYHAAVGHHAEALRLNSECRKLVRQLYGENVCHPDVASVMKNTGEILRRLGCYGESFKYVQETLNMYLKLHESHEHYSDEINQAMASLAVSYSELGREDKAISMWEGILELNRDGNGDYLKTAFVGRCLDNIGVAYRMSTSDVERGIQCHKLAHEIFSCFNGPNHPNCATPLNNIGRALNNEESIDYYERALKIFYAAFGENSNHPSIISTMQHIAEMNQDLGHFDKSLQQLQRAHEMIEQRDDGSHNKMLADSYLLLSSVEKDKGAHSKALTLAQRALHMYKTMYQERDSLDIAKCWQMIGDIHTSDQRYEDAVTAQKNAYSVRCAIYGNLPHPLLRDSLSKLAYACMQTKSYDQSLLYTTTASDMQAQLDQQKVASQYSPCRATIQQLLGDYYKSVGDYKLSLSHYEEVLQYRQQFLPDSDLLIGKAKQNMGDIYLSMGNFNLAMEYYEQSLDVLYKQYPSKWHPEFITVFTSMASCSNCSADFPSALEFMRKALTCAESLYQNEPCIYTARILDGLSHVCVKTNQLSEAKRHSNEALIIKKDIFADYLHPSIIDTLVQLADISYKLKDFRTACHVYEEFIKLDDENTESDDITITAYRQYAEVLTELRLLNKAKTTYRIAVVKEQKAHKEIQNHPHIFTLLRNLGKVCYTLGEYEESVDHYLASLKGAENEAESGTVMADFIQGLHNNLGCAFFQMDKFDKAQQHYEICLEMTKSVTGDTSAETAGAMENLAGVYVRKGQYEKAIGVLKEVLEMKKCLIQQSLLGQDSCASTYSNLGMCCFGNKQYDAAAQFYSQAIKIKEVGSVENMVVDLEYLGRTYLEMKGYNSLIHTLTKLLPRLKEYPDKKKYVSCMHDLGLAYKKTGQFTKAVHSFSELIDLQLQLQNGTVTMDIVKNFQELGECYFQMEQNEAAFNCFQRAREFANQLPLSGSTDQQTLIDILNGLGCACAKQRKFTEATQYLNEAFAFVSALRDTHNYTVLFINISNNLAEIYLKLGDPKASSDYYHSALGAYMETPSEDIGSILTSLLGLAKLEESQGSYRSAEGYIKQGLELLQKKEGNSGSPCGDSRNQCFLSLGNILFLQGRFEEANHYYQQLLNSSVGINRLIRTSDFTAPLMNIGSIYGNQERYFHAVTYYCLAIGSVPLFQRLAGSSKILVYIYTNLGLSYEMLPHMYLTATEYHNRALAYADANPGVLSETVSEDKLLARAANANLKVTNYQEAKTCFLRLLALEESRKSKHVLERDEHYIILQTRIANTCISLGNFQEALKYHEEALRLERMKVPSGDPSKQVGWTLDRIGCVYHCIGDEKTAMSYHCDAFLEKLRLIGSSTETQQCLIHAYENKELPYEIAGEYAANADFTYLTLLNVIDTIHAFTSSEDIYAICRLFYVNLYLSLTSLDETTKQRVSELLLHLDGISVMMRQLRGLEEGRDTSGLGHPNERRLLRQMIYHFLFTFSNTNEEMVMQLFHCDFHHLAGTNISRMNCENISQDDQEELSSIVGVLKAMSQQKSIADKLKEAGLFQLIWPFHSIDSNAENRLFYAVLLVTMATPEEVSMVTIDGQAVKLLLGKFGALLNNPWTRLVKSARLGSLLKCVQCLCRNHSNRDRLVEGGIVGYLNLLLESDDTEEMNLAAELISECAFSEVF